MQLQFPLNLHRNPSYLIILILVVHRNNTNVHISGTFNKNSAHLVGSRVALSFEPSLGWAKAELSINGWHSSAATPKPEQKVEPLGIGWMRVLITDRLIGTNVFPGAIARCGDANGKESIVHRLRTALPDHAASMLRNSLKLMSSEMYSGPCRAFWELLQNADDCRYQESPWIKVAYSSKFLWLEYNEVGSSKG